ncbi:uncharacterized protein [Dermacentor albipictus]|uniref:uncharacterized protein n=1 Tax=Dermacentor albipictus TaxID=60249 RepID=UPI0038FCC20F
MTDAKRGPVHRFRDHVVAGVNWRPTRFVDDVPNVRVCGLCRMIPLRTLVLPCSHVLCQPCYAANCQGGVASCPLDRERFGETQCAFVELCAREANKWKVHCWNESQGCKFVGTAAELLRHYETECAFHTVECLRCGEGVLHSDLSTHFAAGCSVSDSSAATQQPPLRAAGVTLRDLGHALEDIKGLSKDVRPDELLSGLQSLIANLAETARNRRARFAEISRALGTSEQDLRDELTQIATAADTPRPESRQNSARASSASPFSLGSENGLILRKLEHFAHKALNALEYLRQNVARHGQSPVTASCEPLVVCSDSFRRFASSLSEEQGLAEVLRSVCYVLTLENANEILLCREDDRRFAEVTLWHTRDTYLTIAVSKRTHGETCDLVVDVAFDGLLAGSRCVLQDWRVKVRHPVNDCSLGGPHDAPCACARDLDSMKHFHREFNIGLDFLGNSGFLMDGRLIFEIHLELLHETVV